MLLFLDFDQLALPAIAAELPQLAEISLFGLQDTNGCDTSTAFRTRAAVDCLLSARHSRDTLLWDRKECKSKKDDQEAP